MTKDNINPNHYKAGGIETIDLIQDVVKDFGSVSSQHLEIRNKSKQET